MKSKTFMTGLLALGLAAFTAEACIVQVRVACPTDSTASGIEVCIDGVGCATTDNLGIAEIPVPGFATYTVRVTASTLPAGATLSPLSKKIKVDNDAPPVVEFELGGAFCATPPPPGDCWLTGGGTIDKTKGVPTYSFGGVVYPGCSPKAADGGNLNVVEHATALHFKGKSIVVDLCSGVSTRSPKVNVNIIDFHGTGTVSLNGTDPEKGAPVTFVGRAVDNLESGGGSDLLYIKVLDAGGNTVMQIGASKDDPATISTGNLQIHTTSCSN